jgi:hypothetical protein
MKIRLSLMIPAVKRLMRAAADTKAFRLLFLLGSAFFARPRDFIIRPGRAVPRFARSRWIRALPLVPAGVFASTTGHLLYRFGMHKQGIDPAPDPIADAFVSEVGWMALGLVPAIAAVIYSFAVFSYFFHRTCIRMWMRRGHAGEVPPLSFFIVSAAAGASWLALLFVGIGDLIQRYGIDFRGGLNQLVMVHTGAVIVLFGALFVLMKASSRNRRLGMLDVYGGSAVRLNVADLVGAALGVAALATIYAFAR